MPRICSRTITPKRLAEIKELIRANLDIGQKPGHIGLYERYRHSTQDTTDMTAELTPTQRDTKDNNIN